MADILAWETVDDGSIADKLAVAVYVLEITPPV